MTVCDDFVQSPPLPATLAFATPVYSALKVSRWPPEVKPDPFHWAASALNALPVAVLGNEPGTAVDGVGAASPVAAPELPRPPVALSTAVAGVLPPAAGDPPEAHPATEQTAIIPNIIRPVRTRIVSRP
jgi:hypothetical protein